MSSKKRKENVELLPSIERDPVTGKIILQPLPPQFLAPTSGNKRLKESAKKDGGSIERRRKLALELKPLKFSLLNIEESIRPPKIRKLEIPPEPKYGLSSRNSTNFKPRRLAVPTNRKSFIPSNTMETSPLLNLDDVEETLLKNKSSLRGYPFKSPKIVATKYNLTKNKTKRNSIHVRRNSQVPEIENQSKTNKPLKKICTPPAMGRISEEVVEENAYKLSVPVTTEIKMLIERQEDVFKEMTEVYEKYKHIHKENICVLTTILETSENCLVLNKSTTPLKPNNKDLRVSVLKKNLVENKADHQFQSPRTRSAIDLYNSTRISCPILDTPKIQKEANEKFIKSAGKELSEAILSQCLLLQATPKRKS